MNTKQTCRIIGFNPLDGLAQLSLKQSVIDRPFLRYEDVKVGAIVNGTILSVDEFGMVVSLTDQIKGRCVCVFVLFCVFGRCMFVFVLCLCVCVCVLYVAVKYPFNFFPLMHTHGCETQPSARERTLRTCSSRTHRRS